MKNTGVLVANDLKKERLKSLNAIFQKFDRVLLDAPCSGIGVISRDPSIKV